MAGTLNSGRGAYRITLASPPEKASAKLLVTVELERVDGIERFALRCRAPQDALGYGSEALGDGSDALLTVIKAQIERDFEQIREAALKSIRTEQRLLEITIAPPF